MAISPVAISPRTAPPPGPLLIAEDHCKGCEICVGACPKHVLALDRGRVNALGYHPITLTDPPACTSCALCARVCPDAVFTVWMMPRPEARSASRSTAGREERAR